MKSQAYAAYTSALTSTTENKEKILLLLYSGALGFLQRARVAMEEHNAASKGTHLAKAIAIIAELDCALDHTIGGDIAANLSGLYQYMLTSLTHANLTNDAAALHHVERLLRDLQEGFEGAIQAKHNIPSPADTAPSAPSQGLNVAI
jgi:flagellar protein FliS